MQEKAERIKTLSAGAKVLYAEKDQDTASKTLPLLCQIFSQVDFADSCSDAYTLFSVIRHDIVIVDLSFSFSNGISLVEKIKRSSPFQCLVVTSDEKVGADTLISLINSNISYFLRKPYDPSSLLSPLESFLSSRFFGGADDEVRRLKIEMAQKERELYRYKNIDFLTGAKNKRQLHRNLSEMIEGCADETNKPSLMLININNFRSINSSYGYEAGDQILVDLFDRITKAADGRFVARVGGDLFGVAYSEMTFGIQSKILAERLLIDLGRPFSVNDEHIYLSFRIGISHYPDNGTTAAQVFNSAELAMEAVDITAFCGHSGYSFSDRTLQHGAQRSILMESNLRKAIANNDFVVHYQPQFDSETAAVVGAEALVRWNRADIGVVYPGEFVFEAESSGLLIAIDKLVMQEAFRSTAEWHAIGLNPGRISVNISAEHLLLDNFIDNLTVMLFMSSCKPEWITVEITETAVMRNPDAAREKIFHLKELGISVALDDFGTGYSSLSTLRQFPFDKIKIDRSFIRDVPASPDDTAMISKIIEMAEMLKLEIVIEGVETQEQLDFFRSVGRFAIQGFYFSKPLAVFAFENFLRDKRSL